MSQERQTTGLHDAFSQPTPIHPEYASLPIQDGFDWGRCFRSIPALRLYLVVFRRVRRASADLDALKEHDDAAHAEALGAGGLHYYFKGEANERRECLWESRQRALEALAIAWRSPSGPRCTSPTIYNATTCRRCTKGSSLSSG